MIRLKEYSLINMMQIKSCKFGNLKDHLIEDKTVTWIPTPCIEGKGCLGKYIWKRWCKCVECRPHRHRERSCRGKAQLCSREKGLPRERQAGSHTDKKREECL